MELRQEIDTIIWDERYSTLSRPALVEKLLAKVKADPEITAGLKLYNRIPEGNMCLDLDLGIECICHRYHDDYGSTCVLKLCFSCDPPPLKSICNSVIKGDWCPRPFIEEGK